ncbi:MAG: endonuclease/exonuclease/phosphatase family protein, partial [Propionibacteriaceae bacterium]
MTRTPVATISAVLLSLGLGIVGVAAPVATSTAVAATTPPSFSAVTATPGPGIGEVTFTWTHTGANTTGYRVETGLTSFSTTDSSLPVHARGYKYFTFPANVRTATLTAAQVASAGASVSSGNHLYYRFNATNSGTNKFWPYLQQVAVKPAVPAATGTALRVGTFNIRTARATTDKQTWMQRVPAVAASIKAYNPGVLGLQELGPGRADGQTGTTDGTPRQTDSLVTELTKQGAGKYKLVRTTPYVAPGVDSATQGMRILYDTTKYTLVSPCVDKTGTSSYSPSCSITLPIRSDDDEGDRMKAAYAEFADKATGAHFYYVSVHLDSRSSSNATTDKTFDALRGAQAKTAIDAVDKLNTNNYPVILGGDLNTWQNDKAGFTGHDVMISDGYYDTAAAATQVKSNWTTMNHFDTTISDPGKGFGSRLDAVLVKGVTGAVRWENVFKNPDSYRPSDHNMVIADIRLPSQAPATTKYQALTPSRLLDTRTGLGAPKAVVPAAGKVDLIVAGHGGVPLTGVSAVVLNVTVTQPAVGGYATVFPAGVTRPDASTINFPP